MGARCSDSRYWARSSPRTSCSVKFLEPTVTPDRDGRQPSSASAAIPRNERRSISGVSRTAESTLDESEKHICSKRHQGCGNGSDEDHTIIHHGKSAKDEFAEAARTDGGCNRRQSHGQHGGDADSGNDYVGGKRKLHLPQQLPSGKAHGDGRFTDRRVHAADADESVLNDRKQRI